MQHELIKLKNNLRVLFIDSPGATFASTQIWFRAGSALEDFSNEGIAHFLEHMFFKGTPTRPGAQIAHEVESYGGEINAFTSFDYTCYYINSPSTNLINSVEILLDMVSNPMFKQTDLLPERDVVFEEYRRSIDSPNQYSFSKLQQSCFEGPYAHPILGREDTIKNFTREQLADFRERFYNLSNSLLIVSGDLNKKNEIISTIEKYQMPKGETSTFPQFDMKANPTVNVHDKEVRMCTLTLVAKAPSYLDASAAAEDLAINCLGYGETSRLFQTLVTDKTIANNTSASTMFMANGGAHFIRIVFPYENFNLITKKLSDLLNEVFDTGFSNEEIAKIKNQYLSSKIYEKESIESYSFSLGHSFAQTGNINSDDEFIANIKKVSKSQVNNAFKNILRKTIHINLQAPKGTDLKKCEKTLAALNKNLSNLKKNASKSVSKYKIKTSKFDPQAKLITIKPGVSFFYRQNKMTPTFVLHAYLRGGLTDETSNNNGLYNLMSNLLTKGYGKVSNEKLKKDFEEKSSSISGFSGKNAYGILMHGLTEHSSDLFNHFTGCFLNSTFAQKHITHEKQLILRALENHKEDPVKTCFKEAQRIFFNTHPYALNQIGTIESVKKLLRGQLEKTHQKNVKQSEILITYCGDLDLEETLELLKPLFDKVSARKSKPLKIKKYKSITNIEKYVAFDREQTQIFYGIPTGAMKEKDNFYLKLLSTHLSGQSSELFVEVRDRQGLCYSAQPVLFSALEGGYFGIYMASGHDKVQPAIKAIKDLIGNIQKNGLSLEDFNRIKQMIKGQNQINLQTNEDFASVYSIPVLQDEGLDYFHEKNIEIDKLSYKEFQDNIKKILNREWNTIIVGRENKTIHAM